jgi:hypothetical protein
MERVKGCEEQGKLRGCWNEVMAGNRSLGPFQVTSDGFGLGVGALQARKETTAKSLTMDSNSQHTLRSRAGIERAGGR